MIISSLRTSFTQRQTNMIFEVLQIITEELNTYFPGNTVSMGNVANLDSEQDDNGGATEVMLTLLNLQEETSLKNNPNYAVEGHKVIYRNPVVNLNLFVLFSANNASYAEALKHVSKIIEFFQGKKVFTQANTTFNRDDAAMSNIKEFKFMVDLFTPTFEELNFVWGTLGGKQIPSVIYKVSLIQMERDVILSKGEVITQINGELNHKQS